MTAVAKRVRDSFRWAVATWLLVHFVLAYSIIIAARKVRRYSSVLSVGEQKSSFPLLLDHKDSLHEDEFPNTTLG